MLKKTNSHRTWGKSRSTRLKHFDYASPHRAYHVVIGSCKQQHLFCDPILNRRVLEILNKSTELSGYQLIAYCLMPDHLHLLVQAGDKPKPLSDFIRNFKSYSSKTSGRPLWQRSYYEHVIRKTEDIIGIAGYIMGNPIRKGIAKSTGDYRWSKILYGKASSRE